MVREYVESRAELVRLMASFMIDLLDVTDEAFENQVCAYLCQHSPYVKLQSRNALYVADSCSMWSIFCRGHERTMAMESLCITRDEQKVVSTMSVSGLKSRSSASLGALPGGRSSYGLQQ